MLTLLLLTLLTLTSSMLWLSVKRNLILDERLEEIDMSIQNAVLILEEVYDDIDNKSKMEVFYDEPVVRDLMKSMTNAKEAVNSITQLLDDVVIVEGDQEELKES